MTNSLTCRSHSPKSFPPTATPPRHAILGINKVSPRSARRNAEAQQSRFAPSASRFIDLARRQRPAVGGAKRKMEANTQSIRCGSFFVLPATAGDHPFKDAQRGQIRDIRRVPINFAGYSIRYRRGGRPRQGEPDPKWHAHVEIERGQYKLLRDDFLDRAVHRRAETLARSVRNVEFEPYAPVRRQLLAIWRQVNRKRKRHGYELVPVTALRLYQNIIELFGREKSRQASESQSRTISCWPPASGARSPSRKAIGVDLITATLISASAISRISRPSKPAGQRYPDDATSQ